MLQDAARGSSWPLRASGAGLIYLHSGGASPAPPHRAGSQGSQHRAAGGVRVQGSVCLLVKVRVPGG